MEPRFYDSVSHLNDLIECIGGTCVGLAGKRSGRNWHVLMQDIGLAAFASLFMQNPSVLSHQRQICEGVGGVRIARLCRECSIFPATIRYEPCWRLAASDGVLSAARIVALHARRWTNEPSFRDPADLRFGMALSELRNKGPRRRVHRLFHQDCLLYEFIPDMPEQGLRSLIDEYAQGLKASAASEMRGGSGKRPARQRRDRLSRLQWNYGCVRSSMGRRPSGKMPARSVRRESRMAAENTTIGGEQARRNRYRATRSFLELLLRLHCTLVVSVYTASRLVLISAAEGALEIRAHELLRPMGIAVSGAASRRRRLAVSSAFSTLVFSEMPQLAADFASAERPCDSVFLPRACYFTGDIDGHDLAWRGDELLVANTRFSCVARVGDRFGFEPLWRPGVVTALEPEDRCHLNGIACTQDGLAYVTALGLSDSARGWSEKRASGGALIEAGSGETLIDGLSVPHSPRLIEGRLFVCESGQGRILEVDARARAARVLAVLPGFTRGLDALGAVLFVGLSKLRHDGDAKLPLGARADSLLCGVAAVERDTGTLLGWLALDDFDEVFEVRVLPGVVNVVLEGPDSRASNAYLDMPGRVFQSQPPEET